MRVGPGQGGVVPGGRAELEGLHVPAAEEGDLLIPVPDALFPVSVWPLQALCGQRVIKSSLDWHESL